MTVSLCISGCWIETSDISTDDPDELNFVL